MKKKILIALGIGCLLVISWGSASNYFSHQGEVSIVNQAAERVAKGEIEICNQKFSFEGIEPKERKIFLYRVTSDSHYRIALEFESGKKLVKEVGYVTNGLDFKDAVIIKDNDIEMTQ